MENKQSFKLDMLKAIYENSENKLFKESFNSKNLDEGWKDNIKKGLATATLAGGLMANGAQAMDKPMDFNDGAQADGQFTAYYQNDESPLIKQYQDNNMEIEDLPDGGSSQTSSYNDLIDFVAYEGYKNNKDGTFTGKDGKIYSEKEIRDLMLYGEIKEAIDPIESESNDNLFDFNKDAFYQDDAEADIENKPDWYQLWQDSQLKTSENEPFLDYIKRLRDNY